MMSRETTKNNFKISQIFFRKCKIFFRFFFMFPKAISGNGQKNLVAFFYMPHAQKQEIRDFLRKIISTLYQHYNKGYNSKRFTRKYSVVQKLFNNVILSKREVYGETKNGRGKSCFSRRHKSPPEILVQKKETPCIVDNFRNFTIFDGQMSLIIYEIFYHHKRSP